jgi:hypothetical protein
LRNKSGAIRLGFAVLLKFLLWRGPKRRPGPDAELSPPARGRETQATLKLSGTGRRNSGEDNPQAPGNARNRDEGSFGGGR